MEELSKLEHLSLVSKICTELDNHLGMNDKDLAEFIIDLAEENDTLESFKKALIEKGAEFPDSFIANLLRIIQLMKKSKKNTFEDNFKPDTDNLAMKFPGLALANNKQTEILTKYDEKKDEKKDVKKLHSVADDMFSELEASAPSKSGNENEPATRIEKKEEKRERSKERKSRRERSKDRERDKDRSSRRSRSRDKRGRSR